MESAIKFLCFWVNCRLKKLKLKWISKLEYHCWLALLFLRTLIWSEPLNDIFTSCSYVTSQWISGQYYSSSILYLNEYCDNLFIILMLCCSTLFLFLLSVWPCHFFLFQLVSWHVVLTVIKWFSLFCTSNCRPIMILWRNWDWWLNPNYLAYLGILTCLFPYIKVCLDWNFHSCWNVLQWCSCCLAPHLADVSKMIFN